jgi:hypothetical protein
VLINVANEQSPNEFGRRRISCARRCELPQRERHARGWKAGFLAQTGASNFTKELDLPTLVSPCNASSANGISKNREASVRQKQCAIVESSLNDAGVKRCATSSQAIYNFARSQVSNDLNLHDGDDRILERQIDHRAARILEAPRFLFSASPGRSLLDIGNRPRSRS